MKTDKKYAVGQKIPSYVKKFTTNDIKENNINVKNSAILRVLTKWT